MYSLYSVTVRLPAGLKRYLSVAARNYCEASNQAQIVSGAHYVIGVVKLHPALHNRADHSVLNLLNGEAYRV